MLDFGIAKLAQQASDSRLRAHADRRGDGHARVHVARAVPRHAAVDHRTDIYSLGCILFEMLCGRPPFVAEGFGEMVHLHISAPPPAPRSIEPSIPEELERLILWCLAKEPAERVQTMADVHAALTGRPTPPARATAATKPQRLQQSSSPASPTTFTHAAGATVTAEVTRLRRARKWSAVALAVALGGGGLWMTRGSWIPRPADTVTVAPATSAPATASATAAEPPSPLPAATKPPASVKAAIVSDPPGARVVREKDGAVIGMTPFGETWPSGDGVQKLRLELDGYRSETVVVPLDRGVDLSFALRKAAQPEPHKHKDAKHGPARPPAAKVPGPPAPPPAPKPAPRSEPVPL